MSDWNFALQIIDISNPASPSLTTTIDTLPFVFGLAVGNKYVYVADVHGLQVIDISNPASPILVGIYETLGVSTFVTVAGDYAYVGDFKAGLQIINLKPPEFSATYNQVNSGATINYLVAWQETGSTLNDEVACFVNGGSCTVVAIDQALKTATVDWTLPITLGDNEIRVTVGDQTYFTTVKDWVMVE